MRIVLDTNVLVAAFVSRGVCHELVEHCEREHDLITSVELLDEFEGVLVRKLDVPKQQARQARDLVEHAAVLVVPAALDEPVSRDADDDRVLATALAGRCDCIVTGDEDLLVLEVFERVRIIRPTDFWRYERSAETT